MPYGYALVASIPAPPAEVFDARMSSEGHTAMTGRRRGGRARRRWPLLGLGRIHHRRDPGARSTAPRPQRWRTGEFGEDQPDSEIEVLLEAKDGVTLLRLHHRGVPEDQRGYEEGGWEENYLAPMREYFGGAEV